MKKSLMLILLVLMLSATSCGTSAPPSTTEMNENLSSAEEIVNEIETETETELKDAVPENLTFGGADFKFLAAELYGAPSLVEEQNGEVYNDATYAVELYTEERLDVKISEVLTSNVRTDVVQLAAANDTTYDTVSMTDKESVPVAAQGVFHPMAEIPYVDLTQKYWGDGLSETLSIGGKNYFAVSSFNLYSLERTVCLLFNETVAKNHGIEVPFDDVFNGTWTLDMLESYDNIATSDVNGDGVMDDADNYTYGSADARDVAEKLVYASGLTLIDIGEDGLPYVSCYDNERFIDIMERTRNIFFTGNCYADAANINSSELFTKDQEMITIAEFRYMNTFREMESDFSILPLPKFDETQQRYYSRTCNVIFSMIPITAADLEKAGAVQEVMCCEGYKTMLPAYIESAMKNKVARNPESAESIQIIYDTRVLDLGKLYLATYFDTKFYQDLDAGNSVVTKLEKQRTKIDTALNDIITSLNGQ